MSALRYHHISECLFAVHVKLGLQRLLILLAVRAMTSPLRLEPRRRALCAMCLDWDVAEPFRNAQSWVLHSLTFNQEHD